MTRTSTRDRPAKGCGFRLDADGQRRAALCGPLLLLLSTACPEPPPASDASAVDARVAIDAASDGGSVDVASQDSATPDTTAPDQGVNDSAIAPECETSADCDGETATQGYLCLAGTCTRCASNNQCATDEHYGDQARCSSGRCNSCPDGNQGCPCLQSGACAGVLQCVSGTCLDCARGSEGCRCYSNASCDGTLVCTSDVCVPCTPGSLGCRCDAGACQGDLQCSNDLCAPRACPAGQEGCACDGTSCDSGLYCTGAGLCAVCVDDVVGCPCTEGTCSGGLACDGTSTLCREPVLCAAAGCVAHQRCDEPPGEDAVCLPDCTAGYFWDSSSQSCQVTRPNCEPGAEGSILAVCQALYMTCVASSSGATCSGCEDGAKPVSSDVTAGCRPVWTCATLCTATGRDCVSEAVDVTDATCGGCLQDLVALDPAHVETGCTDAIYADPAAAPGGKGGRWAPLANLASAVTAAASLGLDVKLATGTFNQSARIVLRDDLALLGGYDPATWQRTSERTRVVTADNVVFQLNAVNDVTLEQLDGESAGSWGSSNGFGLLGRNGSNLVVRNCLLRARAGNPGASGTEQHTPALEGEAGSPGTLGYGSATAFTLTGGAGGACPCDASHGGGRGGEGRWGDSTTGGPGEQAPGSSATPGLGVPPLLGNHNPTLEYVGGDGEPGSEGAAGAAVPGLFDVTYYRARAGADGQPGTPGFGGCGGGGGGGGVASSLQAAGSSGGGGGGGGCGGLGGGGGSGGGGSFGIYLFNYSFVIEDCHVIAGDGGAGGDGAPGQPGAVGGAPGRAAVGTNNKSVGYTSQQGTASNGGRGGFGGAGGGGGPGAGGAGGPSIGIVIGGTASGTVLHTTVEIGQAGVGGGGPGTPGPDGFSAEQYTP
ncbi:MAG: hypothetical protein ABIJ09_18355 [Pseudomonadota bacterium]